MIRRTYIHTSGATKEWRKGGAPSGAFQRDNGEKDSTSRGGEEINQEEENEVRGVLRIEKKEEGRR